MFVAMYEKMFATKVDGIIRLPATSFDYEKNANLVIALLSKTVLQADFSKLTGEKVVGGDIVAVRSLVCIFSHMHDILTATTSPKRGSKAKVHRTSYSSLSSSGKKSKNNISSARNSRNGSSMKKKNNLGKKNSSGKKGLGKKKKEDLNDSMYFGSVSSVSASDSVLEPTMSEKRKEDGAAKSKSPVRNLIVEDVDVSSIDGVKESEEGEEVWPVASPVNVQQPTARMLSFSHASNVVRLILTTY